MPPVYDGIQVPAEPYNWESPPPELKNGNKPPSSGASTFAVLNGRVAGGSVQTDDDQVLIFFGAGALMASTGAQTVTCTIQPVSNPPPAPSGAEIRGNVYRFECIEVRGGTVRLVGTTRMTLQLPAGTTNDIRYFDGRSWRILATSFAPGGGPHAGAEIPGFGEYAATARVDILTILGRYVEAFGILAFVVIFGIIAVVQEIRRRQHRTS